MISSPINTIEIEKFRVEVYESLRGTIAYRFYCNDKVIYQNNNLYVDDKEILNNRDKLFNKIAEIVLQEQEYKETCQHKDELDFLCSTNYNLLKEITKKINT